MTRKERNKAHKIKHKNKHISCLQIVDCHLFYDPYLLLLMPVSKLASIQVSYLARLASWIAMKKGE